MWNRSRGRRATGTAAFVSTAFLAMLMFGAASAGADPVLLSANVTPAADAGAAVNVAVTLDRGYALYAAPQAEAINSEGGDLSSLTLNSDSCGGPSVAAGTCTLTYQGPLAALHAAPITLVSDSCTNSLEQVGPCTLTFEVAPGVLANKKKSTPPVEYLKVTLQEVRISS